jgi:hypothetical protein
VPSKSNLCSLPPLPTMPWPLTYRTGHIGPSIKYDGRICGEEEKRQKVAIA